MNYGRKINWLPWYILIFAILFYCLDFFFRISPSLVVSQLMHQYHVSSVGIGVFASAFYLGYVVMQIPTGIILDRFNLRSVFILAIFSCCISYIWFVLASNFYVGVSDRFVVGMGSAFSFIGTLYIAKKYLPAKFFTLIAGITIAFGTLGSSAVQIVAALFFKHYSWHSIFEVIAAIGFILMIFVLAVINKPLRPLNLNKKTITESYVKQMLQILSHKKLVINAIIGGLFYLPTSIFAGLWGISFLHLQYHFDNTQSSSGIMLLFLGWSIGSPIIGYFAGKCNYDRVLIIFPAIVASLLSIILLFSSSLNNIAIYLLLFFIGLASSFQVMVWGIFSKITVGNMQGVAIAITNMIIMAIAALFHIFVGELMNYHHGHLFTKSHILYSLTDYHLALSIIPLAFILVVFLSFFIVNEF